MKAMALTGPRRIEAVERPEPVPLGSRDVLLRVESVGVCGSDIHYYTDGRIGSQVVQYPFLVGHECSATVLAVGSDVRRAQVGDRVAVEPAISCGECDQCRAGRRHTCRRLRFLGCPGQLEGCLCERIVMPEECCFPIPADMSFDQAALVEPLSIGLYAVRLSGLRSGARIGILGAGPIGLSVGIAARAAGASSVYFTEPIPERRRAAESLGAGWTADPYTADAAAALAEREPGLLDIAFECSGRQEAMDDGIRILRPGGTLMLIGIPAYDRVSFEIDLLRRREIRIQNVRRQNECMEPAIALATARATEVHRLLTHTFAFERTNEAFDRVAGYRDGVIKAVIRMPSGAASCN